jgi:uncharacterized repeat protein (TIGR02543 family)
VQITATPNSGYAFTGWSGDLTGTENPKTVTMSGNRTVTANFVSSPVTYQHTITSSPAGLTLTVDGAQCSTPCTRNWTSLSAHTITGDFKQPLSPPNYYFSYLHRNGTNEGQDTWASGNLSYTVIAPSSASTYTAVFKSDGLQALRDCLTSANRNCILAAGTHTVDALPGTIVVNRSNVTIWGATANMAETKLVRAPSFQGDLIQIGQPSGTPVSGVALRYLTVCGGSNIAPNWANPAPSPVGCPRVQTDCGDNTKKETQEPGQGNPAGQCVDVRVRNAALPGAPQNLPDPFGSPPATYAVEFDHVDLEDATGHALSLRGYPQYPVNDIYFHDGAINYSGVTAILIGVDGVHYGRKLCDEQADFANSSQIWAPRNIRVERSQFTENRTGVTGGIARWMAFKDNNTFTRNYIWPQAQGCVIPGSDPPAGDPNRCWGGTLEFDACADQILIKDNSFVGPGADHANTQALELYGRNITVDHNNISGYQLQGIVANSLKHATIQNNTITFPAPSIPEDGGITVSTVGAGGACTDANNPLNIYRESRDITITGNTISGQYYGVNLAEHPWRSTGGIHDLTIGSNAVSSIIAPYWLNPFVWANSFNGYSGPTLTLGPQAPLDPGITPRALPIDVESTGGRALCPSSGAARAAFTFAASDDSNGSANLPEYLPAPDHGTTGYSGAAQILYIEGVFSTSGPAGEPSLTWQDCHFKYDADSNVVYLDDGTGTWGAGSSPVGAGGQNLTSPGACIVHAATSSASAAQTGQYARSLTLDVEFLGTSPTRHVYFYTMNKNGVVSYAHYDTNSPVIWQYWGWWKKQ